MKKTISIIALLLTIAGSTAEAATYTVGQTITGRTTEGVTITARVLDVNERTCRLAPQCVSTSTRGKVTVPSTIEGFKVVEAGIDSSTGAFECCKSITSVVLPSTITKLDRYCFWYCEALTSVNFSGAAVDTIDYQAFYNCIALTSIALPSTVKYLGGYCFSGCTSLTTITGIASVEYIGDDAFSNTPWYASLPDGLIYIGKVLYRYKGNMPANTVINVKEGTTCITAYALSGGSNLVGVTIPQSVNTIERNAFGSHYGLESISVAAGNTVYDSRGGCNAIIERATNTLIVGCNTTVIPTTVKAIGYDAFYGSRITEVSLPDAVDSLASYAFNNCSQLISLTVGRGLRKIDPYAFSDCSKLSNIVVSSANPYFDSRNNCNAIVETATNTLRVAGQATVIPSTVKAIGERAYYSLLSGVLTFTIPNQIESLGQQAFEYNSDLRSLTIGSGMKSIDKYAFYGCNNLAVIHALMETPFEINENVFYSTKWDGETTLRDSIYNHATLCVPRGCRINYQSTAGWSKFKNIVEADEGQMVVGDLFTSATTEGHQLTYQVTSSSPKTCMLIGSPTDISGTVTIPVTAEGYTVIAIGERVFYSNSNNDRHITAVTMPSNITSIGDYAFYNCDGLTAIELPSKLETIGNDAFYHCRGLTSVVLPSKLESIGNDAFYDCDGLTSVVFPGRLESIGNWAFYSCNGLTSIELPSSLKSVGDYAFYTCWSLTVGPLPASLETIGKKAFYGTEDSSLVIPAKTTSIGTGAFAYMDKLKSIRVEAGNSVYYSPNDCNAIIERSTNTLVVGCSTTVIPQSVRTIGDYAFYEVLNGVYTLSVPTQVKTIGEYAFAYNSDLRSLTFGSGVTSIGRYAFSGCDRLAVVHANKTGFTPADIDETVFDFGYSIYRNGSYVSVPDSIYNTATLCVPVGKKSTFQNLSGWSKFKNIVEANDGEAVVGDVFTHTTTEGHLLTYQVTSLAPKTCMVIGSPTDISGAVTIPETAEGYTVTAIGARAFYSYNNDRHVSAVAMPATITSIDDYAFYYCEDLTIGTLPAMLERIGAWAFAYCQDSSLHLPAKTTSIGRGTFCGMTNLTSITVEEGNSVYTSPEGSNAIVERATNRLVAGCKTAVIPENVVCIGEYAFGSQTDISSIDIHEGVTTIEAYAFNNCQGLATVSLPSTIDSIADYAFRYCDQLMAIYCKMITPPAISEDVFKPRPELDGPFKTATLYVPRGTKEVYAATDGWSSFEHIEEGDYGLEIATVDDVDYILDGNALTAKVQLIHRRQADVVIPAQVAFDGKTYTVTGVGSIVFCADNVAELHSVTFPATITQVSASAFARYNPSAIVWESMTTIPDGAFSAAGYQHNFLLYVKEAQVAPTGVANVIVNGVSTGSIVLTDTWKFHCLQEFRAARVSYTHNYTMETGLGHSAGWETISLPFDVQTITHETNGQIVPFAAYHEESDRLPFWLYSLGSNGFVKASSIKANTPYIISMPNNDSYAERYNIAGKVTFTATNATVRRTADEYLNTSSHNGATFLPCYDFCENSDGIFALNVPNARTTNVGQDTPGSIFLTGGGITVLPFGARMEKVTAARSLNIVFADETDGIDDVLNNAASTSGKVKVYNLAGQMVGEYDRSALGTANLQLAPGIYVIDGKRVSISR